MEVGDGLNVWTDRVELGGLGHSILFVVPLGVSVLWLLQMNGRHASPFRNQIYVLLGASAMPVIGILLFWLVFPRTNLMCGHFSGF